MISHTGTDGSTPADRIKRVGYVPGRTGENCAEGQWTVGEVMTGWMKSPGHRANILANYTEMGAAWARDDQGTIYWCVDFGTPRSGRTQSPGQTGRDRRRGDQADQPRPGSRPAWCCSHPDPTLSAPPWP